MPTVTPSAMNPATVETSSDLTDDPATDPAPRADAAPEPIDRPRVALLVGARDGGSAGLPADVHWRPESWSDPYAMIARLARGSRDVAAVILPLGALREGELAVIRTIKRYYPHIDVFVTDVGPHGTALAEAVIYGADGICTNGLLHRFHAPPPPPPSPPPATTAPPATGAVPHPQPPQRDDPPDSTQPVLTSEELQALLGDFDADE